MVDLAAIQIPAPDNWQDFQRLCRALWEKLLGDPNTQQYGAEGQEQRGVDVVGVRAADAVRVGVQCKVRRAGRRVTPGQIREEVEKAKAFTPALDEYVVATTAPRDGRAQDEAARLTEAADVPFRVMIYGWEDLVECLGAHPAVVRDHFPWLVPDVGEALQSYLQALWNQLVRLPMQILGTTETPLPAVYTHLDVEHSLHARDPGAEAFESPEISNPYLVDLVAATTEEANDGAEDQHGQGTPPAIRLSAVHWLAAHPRAVLVGAPGSGKSSLAKYVALCLAGERLQGPTAGLSGLVDAPTSGDPTSSPANALGIWPHGALIPLWVELQAFAGDDRFPPTGTMPTAEHLLDYLFDRWHDLASGLRHDLRRRLATDTGGAGVLLILDGLDEVTGAEQIRERLIGTVRAFVDAYPKCRVLITTRPYAYEPGSEWRLDDLGFQPVTLASLSPPRRAHFVRRWYAHLADCGKLDPRAAKSRAAALVEQAASPRLDALTRRPLLLTMVASLHGRGTALLSGRAELYEECVKLLFDQWNEGRGLTDPSTFAGHVGLEPTQVLEGFREIAFRVHRDQIGGAALDRGASPIPLKTVFDVFSRRARPSCELGDSSERIDLERLLRYLADRSGLLLEDAPAVYRFPHRSFQEYLAARHLTADDDFPENVAEHIPGDPRPWREVLTLTLLDAAKNKSQAWNLLDELLDEPSDDLHDQRRTAILAHALVESGLHVDARRKTEGRAARRVAALRHGLLAAVANGALDAEDRVLAGEALGALDDPRIGHRDDNFLPVAERASVRLGRFPVTVAEFAEFIDAGGYREPSIDGVDVWGDEGWRARESGGWTEPWGWSRQQQHRNRPVVGVSWFEATAYCRWRSVAIEPTDLVRLPTEDEWVAARSPDDRPYPWGDDLPDEQRANYAGRVGAPTPVGIYPSGRGPAGHLDLAGNVWEWYGVDHMESGLGGGSWSHDSVNLRVGARGRIGAGGRFDGLGFRVAYCNGGGRWRML